MSDHNPNLTTGNELTENQLDEVSGGGKALSEITITKPVDVATPKLFEAACKGTHIPEVTIAL
jgi:bacteriocin-like protein